ncbi:MAG: succinate--CoA ligase subunit alpha [Promethearchaeota archaeon]
MKKLGVKTTVYINKNSRVIIQGITGNQGKFHAKLMLDFNTNIVAGVTPNKGGQEVHGIPVYNTVNEAVKEHNADTSIVFVPARFTREAIEESLFAGIGFICIITENIPVHDVIRVIDLARKRKTRILGPNTPGILIPDQIKLGIMPNDLSLPGEIALISKSGTLSYEIAHALKVTGLGLTAFIGIGGDPVRGITMMEAVKYYEKNTQTKFIVLIGEIGGDEEEKVAEYIKNGFSKPVIAYIAGKHAPQGKRMGHAGAIISGNAGTAQGKIKALREAGAHIAEFPWEIPKIIIKKLKGY